MGNTNGPIKVKLLKNLLKTCPDTIVDFKILDIGGTRSTSTFMRDLFPGSDLYHLNIDPHSLKGVANAIIADGTRLPFRNGLLDMVTSFDTIEHLISPDTLVKEVHRVLKQDGLFALATPNLADIYSRLAFLAGYVPFSYNPSDRRVGTAFTHATCKGEHKSVFTHRALQEMLQYYGFRIRSKAGYSYYDKFYRFIEPQSESSELGFRRLRSILNTMLPVGLKEGLLFLCQKS
jgi:SAM-dependent methyltransferase